MSLSKQKSASMFGINDCIKPKKNTKKNNTFNLTRKIISKKTQKNKPYNYKTIVLFLHSLGQAHLGTEKAPLFIKKFINHKTHNVKTVTNSGNFYKNINKLYKVNKNTRGKIVNIGGDHSMAIATIADTLNKHPNAKVIYFDAHADINTYDSSNSKHFHGMPLSFVIGLDKDKRFPFIKHKLPFANLLYIGSRCWDSFEIDTVEKNNIKYLTPDDINNNLKESLQKIMDFVGDSPVHVSFDVDSIDPKYIPSTGTPVKRGIQLNNAVTILNHLNNKNIVNMDITELNMSLGSKADGIKSGKNTVALFKKFII